MRTDTNSLSLGWVGAVPNKWVSAINPLPDDFAVGAFSLTLQNVIVGSAIQIETTLGGPLFNTTAATSSVLIPLLVYGDGSPRNDLRIKVRRGSGAPFYQPWETLAVAVIGAQSIFVSQIPDE